MLQFARQVEGNIHAFFNGSIGSAYYNERFVLKKLCCHGEDLQCSVAFESKKRIIAYVTIARKA